VSLTDFVVTALVSNAELPPSLAEAAQLQTRDGQWDLHAVTHPFWLATIWLAYLMAAGTERRNNRMRDLLDQ
jgi:hypothetical protein